MKVVFNLSKIHNLKQFTTRWTRIDQAPRLDYARSRKEVPLKDIIFFWNRLKKRSNTEVLETYSEIMKELHLTVLDSVLPDLCRFEKEITHAKRSFFRCTMLPPPAKLLAGSGIAEMAEELIVKLNLK